MNDASDCGCCAGTAIETPVAKSNSPGLPAIVYRVGTQPTFKATLLARLSSTDFPALAPLTSRSDDDWTIALCDAFACMADVITFYQERIGNESYLRTALERRSVLELARLIGYKLAPGVAASTAFAFTLESAPGQPALAAQPVTIPAGTRVQSIPDPSQDPQNFETLQPINARVEWSAIPARSGQSIVIAPNLTELYLEGTNHQIQQGDAIAIVSRQRVSDIASNRWDVRWVDEVEIDAARNVTRLAWRDGLGSQWSPDPPLATGVHVYVFRQRAALFGASAPDANLLITSTNHGLFDGTTPPGVEWTTFVIDSTGQAIDLDAAYPKIVNRSWFALAGGTGGVAPIGLVQLYRVDGVSQLARKDYGLSAKVTRLKADTTANLAQFGLRTAQVLAQSDELPVAPRPLLYPVFGGTLELGHREPDLAPKQWLAVSGKRQRVAIPRSLTGISFPDKPSRSPKPGETFAMLAAPEKQIAGEWQVLDPDNLDPTQGHTGTWRWTLVDHDGKAVKVVSPAGALVLLPSLKDDEVISEVVTIAAGASSILTDLEATTVTLAKPLVNCYERASVAVNANVAPASHGETVAEIAGSGHASVPNPTFVLKQSPLTHVSSASDPSGAESTLQVRVNDLLWHERRTLYGALPGDRVYALRQDDEGRTITEFGDGVQGSRLPTAQNNVRLAYRKGIGTAGNLRAGQLTSLLTRPLGVKGVTNANPATGGQDPETLADGRRNAPLRVLTLDRAVSVRDYADFSRAFAGIAKAYAAWITETRAHGIYVTVAGANGSPIPAGSDTQQHLIEALRNYGDPLLPLSVQSYGKATFTLKANVRIAPDADGDKTLAAVEAALRAAYSFDARDFGEPVTIDEVYAVIQGVENVVASDIDKLYRLDVGPVAPQPKPRLFAKLPAVQSNGTVNAAELLTLDPGPLELGLMPLPK